MVVSGALTGVALTFRLTPAFSASCGIAVALVAHHLRWRDWLGDGLRFSAGLLAAISPVLLWFSLTVGLPRLWHEVVVHPLLMLQALPAPVDPFPEVWDRGLLTTARRRPWPRLRMPVTPCRVYPLATGRRRQ